MRSERKTIVTMAVGVLVTVTLGIFYAWSVFVIPLAKHLGCSEGAVSTVYTVQMVAFCIGCILNGRLQCSGKRLLPAMWIAAVMMGGGFILNGLAQTLSGIYLSYGMLFAFGVGLGYSAVVGAVVGWFPQKKGLATGILMMGYGIGSLVWSTLCTHIMEIMELRYLFGAIGILFIVIIGGGGVVLDHYNERIKAVDQRAGSNLIKVATGDHKPSQLVKTKLFYLFYLWLFFYAVCGQSFISSISPMAVSIGTTSMTAAVIVGVTAIFNGLGRILIGALLDRFKLTRILLLLSLFLTGILGVLIIAIKTDSIVLFIIGAVGMGISFSGIPISMTVFVLETWGMRYYAANYSIANTCMIPQSLIGVMLFTKIVSGTGEYLNGCYFLIVLAVLLIANTAALAGKYEHTVKYKVEFKEKTNNEQKYSV